MVSFVTLVSPTEHRITERDTFHRYQGDKEAMEQVCCKPPGDIRRYMDMCQLTQPEVPFINRFSPEDVEKMASQLSAIFTRAEKLAIIYQKCKKYSDSASKFSPEQLAADRHIQQLSTGVGEAPSYNCLRLLKSRILALLHDELSQQDAKAKQTLNPYISALFQIFYKLEISADLYQVEKPETFLKEAIQELNQLVPTLIKELTALRNEQNAPKINELAEELNFLLTCVNSPDKLYPLLLISFNRQNGAPNCVATRVSLEESARAARVYSLAVLSLQELPAELGRIEQQVKKYVFSKQALFLRKKLLQHLKTVKAYVESLPINLNGMIDEMMRRSNPSALDQVMGAFNSNEGSRKEHQERIKKYLEALDGSRSQIDLHYLAFMRVVNPLLTDAKGVRPMFAQFVTESQRKVDVGLLEVVSKFNGGIDKVTRVLASHLHHSNQLLNVSSGALVHAAKESWSKVDLAAAVPPVAAAAATAGETVAAAAKAAEVARPVMVTAPAAPAASLVPEERPGMAVAAAAAPAPAHVVYKLREAALSYMDLVNWFNTCLSDKKHARDSVVQLKKVDGPKNRRFSKLAF